jgi:hypothetical protein
MQPSFYRVGAGAGMLGAALGIVFNVLHPRDGDALDSARAELQMIADSGIWKLDHVMLALAVVIGFVGIMAIGFSMANTPGELWARAAVVFGAVSTAVGVVLIAIDGVALKALADQWAGGDDSILPAATAVVEMNSAWFWALMATFFGITPLLVGEAVLASGVYPRNLGYVELAGGALALVAALIIAIDGLSTLTAMIMFPIASIAHTVVLFILSWTLWNRAASMVTVTTTTTATTTTAA